MKEPEFRQSSSELLESLKTDRLYYGDYIAEIQKRWLGLIPDNLPPDARFYNFVSLIIIQFICSAYGNEFKDIHDDFLKMFLV